MRILYCLLIAILAVATFVEWRMGTPWVSHHIYGAWWFVALIAIITTWGLVFLFKHTKKPGVILIHLALTLICVGAGVTHFFAISGSLHLRSGQAVTSFVSNDGLMLPLPKNVTLTDFNVVTYPGTSTPMDFVSKIMIDNSDSATVSMNRVVSVDGYRLFQASFDPDHQGSVFMVNYDPWGMGITYCGYFLFFVSLLWMLINPKGRFREIVRKLSEKNVAASLFCMLIAITSTSCSNTSDNLPSAPDADEAKEFAKVCIFYNGRIVPLNTYATDFCLKLTGKSKWKGLSPEQVLLGWITHPEEWQYEKMLKVKNPLPDSCGVKVEKGYTSVSELFDSEGNFRVAFGINDHPSKGMTEINDKMQLIVTLTNGSALKMFPIADESGKINWYSSTEQLPNIKEDGIVRMIHEWAEITRTAFDSNDKELVSLIPLQIARYQLKVCGETLPSPQIRRLEIAYNRIRPASWLFKIQLTLGFILLAFSIRQVAKGGVVWLNRVLGVLIVILLIANISSLTVRGIVSGYFPVSNGYETMLFLALSILGVGLFVRKIQVMLGALSVLLSGFALLVAHIGMSNPNITPLMPVLHSPWLSSHVMSVMIAYSLFTVITVNALVALIIGRNGNREQAIKFRDISLLLLYPAVALLGYGIFIGAIWANESWGSYWNWDPKEVWALITLLVYVIPLHSSLFPKIQSCRNMNIYLLCAFITVLMTYFGVNYLLGGMHSYAG